MILFFVMIYIIGVIFFYSANLAYWQNKYSRIAYMERHNDIFMSACYSILPFCWPASFILLVKSRFQYGFQFLPNKPEWTSINGPFYYEDMK
jgi:hypothetical protein